MPRNAPYVLDPYNTFRDMRLPVASPPDLLTEARQQLQQQANPAQPAEAALATPNQDEYGIFGPQYAAALARPTGASGADAINFANLSMQARGERSAYEHALERAQQGAVQLADQHGYYDVLTSMQAHEPNRVVSDTHSVQIDPVTHRATIVADPTASRVDNQVRLNTAQSEIIKNNAAAAYDRYRSGIRTPVETMEGMDTPPTQAAPTQYGVFNDSAYGPSDRVDEQQLPIQQEQADAAMVAARAAATRAERGTPDTVTYQYLPGADPNNPITTVRTHGGPPNQMPAPPMPHGQGPQVSGPTPAQQRRMDLIIQHGGRAQMSGNILVAIDPQGQTHMFGPNNEPIAQQGAPPGQGRGGAHPAAFSLNGVAGTRSFSTPYHIREHGTPINDANVAIQTVFPGAHITQWTRDPNSALGRANPDSWHNRSRAAVDMHPVHGMTFDQAANQIRAHGYRIIEGIDEVNHPSKHATGPHWHWVLGHA